MRTIKANRNQSLADIAILEYGNIQGLFWLIEDNPQLNGLTDNLYAGQELNIRTEKLNRRMVNYLSQEDLATIKGANGEGIAFWELNRDFVVS